MMLCHPVRDYVNVCTHCWELFQNKGGNLPPNFRSRNYSKNAPIQSTAWWSSYIFGSRPTGRSFLTLEIPPPQRLIWSPNMEVWKMLFLFMFNFGGDNLWFMSHFFSWTVESIEVFISLMTLMSLGGGNRFFFPWKFAHESHITEDSKQASALFNWLLTFEVRCDEGENSSFLLGNC